MKFFLYLLLFIVIAVFGLTFALKNPSPVELHYYPDLVISAPLYLVLLVTLMIGVLIGLIVMWSAALRWKWELVRLRKENRKLGQEVQNLRNIPIKEQPESLPKS